MPEVASSTSMVPDPADSRVETLRIAAIIGMALGLSGLICLPYRAFFEVAGPRSTEGTPPLGYWPAVFAIAGLLLSLILCMGSMAAFRLKPTARPLLLAYAIGTLVFGASALFFYVRSLAANRGQNMEFRWGGMGMVYELTMWPIAVAFSIYLLYAMTRPRTRALLVKGGARDAMDPKDR